MTNNSKFYQVTPNVAGAALVPAAVVASNKGVQGVLFIYLRAPASNTAAVNVGAVAGRTPDNSNMPDNNNTTQKGWMLDPNTTLGPLPFARPEQLFAWAANASDMVCVCLLRQADSGVQ
jgi:hypothetical protein